MRWLSLRILIEFQWSDFDILSNDWCTNSILSWFWIIEKNAMSARSHKKKMMSTLSQFWIKLKMRCQLRVNFESNWKWNVNFKSISNHNDDKKKIYNESFRLEMSMIFQISTHIAFLTKYCKIWRSRSTSLKKK